MPQYMQLPSGSYVEIPEGMDPNAVYQLAQQQHPREFLTPDQLSAQQGFFPAAKSAASGFIGSTEQALGRAFNYQPLQNLGEKTQAEAGQGYMPTTQEDVDKAFNTGIMSGVGALSRKYLTEPLGEMAGRYGVPTVAGALAAAAIPEEATLGLGALGTMGLQGAVRGAVMTATDLPAEVNDNLQYQQHVNPDLPPDALKATAAGIGQAVLASFGVPGFGYLPRVAKNLFGKDLGHLSSEVVAGKMTQAEAVDELSSRSGLFLKNAAANYAGTAALGVGSEALQRAQADQPITDEEAQQGYKQQLAGAIMPAALFGGLHTIGARGKQIDALNQQIGIKQSAKDEADAAAKAQADQQAAQAQKEQAQSAAAQAAFNAAPAGSGFQGDMFGGATSFKSTDDLETAFHQASQDLKQAKANAAKVKNPEDAMDALNAVRDARARVNELSGQMDAMGLNKTPIDTRVMASYKKYQALQAKADKSGNVDHQAAADQEFNNFNNLLMERQAKVDPQGAAQTVYRALQDAKTAGNTDLVSKLTDQLGELQKRFEQQPEATPAPSSGELTPEEQQRHDELLMQANQHRLQNNKLTPPRPGSPDYYAQENAFYAEKAKNEQAAAALEKQAQQIKQAGADRALTEQGGPEGMATQQADMFGYDEGRIPRAKDTTEPVTTQADATSGKTKAQPGVTQGVKSTLENQEQADADRRQAQYEQGNQRLMDMAGKAFPEDETKVNEQYALAPEDLALKAKDHAIRAKNAFEAADGHLDDLGMALENQAEPGDRQKITATGKTLNVDAARNKYIESTVQAIAHHRSSVDPLNPLSTHEALLIGSELHRVLKGAKAVTPELKAKLKRATQRFKTQKEVKGTTHFGLARQELKVESGKEAEAAKASPLNYTLDRIKSTKHLGNEEVKQALSVAEDHLMRGEATPALLHEINHVLTRLHFGHDTDVTNLRHETYRLQEALRPDLGKGQRALQTEMFPETRGEMRTSAGAWQRFVNSSGHITTRLKELFNTIRTKDAAKRIVDRQIIGHLEVNLNDLNDRYNAWRDKADSLIPFFRNEYENLHTLYNKYVSAKKGFLEKEGILGKTKEEAINAWDKADKEHTETLEQLIKLRKPVDIKELTRAHRQNLSAAEKQVKSLKNVAPNDPYFKKFEELIKHVKERSRYFAKDETGVNAYFDKLNTLKQELASLYDERVSKEPENVQEAYNKIKELEKGIAFSKLLEATGPAARGVNYYPRTSPEIQALEKRLKDLHATKESIVNNYKNTNFASDDFSRHLEERMQEAKNRIFSLKDEGEKIFKERDDFNKALDDYDNAIKKTENALTRYKDQPTKQKTEVEKYLDELANKVRINELNRREEREAKRKAELEKEQKEIKAKLAANKNFKKTIIRYPEKPAGGRRVDTLDLYGKPETGRLKTYFTPKEQEEIKTHQNGIKYRQKVLTKIQKQLDVFKEKGIYHSARIDKLETAKEFNEKLLSNHEQELKKLTQRTVERVVPTNEASLKEATTQQNVENARLRAISNARRAQQENLGKKAELEQQRRLAANDKTLEPAKQKAKLKRLDKKINAADEAIKNATDLLVKHEQALEGENIPKRITPDKLQAQYHKLLAAQKAAKDFKESIKGKRKLTPEEEKMAEQHEANMKIVDKELPFISQLATALRLPKPEFITGERVSRPRVEKEKVAAEPTETSAGTEVSSSVDKQYREATQAMSEIEGTLGEHLREKLGPEYDYREHAGESGVDLEHADRIVRDVQSKLPNGMKFEYYARQADLPEADKAAMARAGRDSAKGFVTPDGRIVVIGEHHADVADLQKTIAHELIGHYSVEGVLGPEGINELTKRVFANGREDAFDLAADLGVYAQAKFAYDDAINRGASEEAAQAAFTKEMIAYTAENKPIKRSIADKIKGFLQGVVQAVRNALAKIGLVDAAKVTPNEIYKLISDAQRAFERNELGFHRDANGEPVFRDKEMKFNGADRDVADVIRTVVPTKNTSSFNRLKAAVSGFRTATLDRFDSLSRIMETYRKTGTPAQALMATQMMYFVRTFERGLSYASQMMANGSDMKFVKTQRPDGSYEWTVKAGTSGNSIPKVLRALGNAKIAGLNTPEEKQAFFTTYMALERAQQTGKSIDMLNFEADQKLSPEKVVKVLEQGRKDAAIQEARKAYNAYNKGLIDMLHDADVIDQATRDRLKQDDYVPYYRVDENGDYNLMLDNEKFFKVGSLQDQPHLHELVGDNRKINNAFVSSMQNTRMLVDMALRNQASKSIGFTLNSLGFADKASPGVKASNNKTLIRFKVNGEEQAFQVNSKVEDMLGIPAKHLIQGLDGVTPAMPGFVKMLRLPAIATRFVTEVNPLFAPRLLFKHSLFTWLTGGANTIPLVDAMRVLKSTHTGKLSDVGEMLRQQGITGVGSALHFGDPDVQAIMKQIMTGADKKLNVHTFTSFMESQVVKNDAAIRESLYNRFIKQGLSPMEASMAALESTNFSRRGASGSIRALTQTIPFMNALLQGLDVTYRTLAGRASFEDKVNARAKMIQRGAMLGAATLAYGAAMQSNPKYQQTSIEDRANNWLVFIPGVDEPLKLPIPFEPGLMFKALPEMVMGMAHGDLRSRDVVHALGAAVGDSMPSVIPEALSPILQTMTNYSFLSGHAIEGQRLQGLAKSERYDEDTSELAKFFGQYLGSPEIKKATGWEGISPKQIDFLVHEYLGGLGHAFTTIPNYLTGPARPTLKAHEIPLVGSEFADVSGRNWINEAMDGLSNDKQMADTFNNMIAQGDAAGAQKFAAQYQKDIAMGTSMAGFQKQLQDLGKMERVVYANPSMAPDQKRDLIDRIREARTEMAKQYALARRKLD